MYIQKYQGGSSHGRASESASSVRNVPWVFMALLRDYL